MRAIIVIIVSLFAIIVARLRVEYNIMFVRINNGLTFLFLFFLSNIIIMFTDETPSENPDNLYLERGLSRTRTRRAITIIITITIRGPDSIKLLSLFRFPFPARTV